jgi:hypothetical protein
VDHDEDQGKQKKQMNQSTGYMKEHETSSPQDHQQYRNAKKWSESHDNSSCELFWSVLSNPKLSKIQGLKSSLRLRFFT